MKIVEILIEYQDRTRLLSKYKNDPNIYITFTDIEKVGVNPQSIYNTPLGVYAYPVKQIWDYIERDTIPFAGEKPWIQVLRGKNVVELSDYTQNQLNTDIDKLYQLYSDDVVYSDEEYKKIETQWYQNNPGNNPSAFDNYIDNLYYSGEIFKHMIDIWSNEAFNPDLPASCFWNITRNIAMLTTQRQSSKQYLKRNPSIATGFYIKMAKPACVRWNTILRQLGYVAFSDKTGLGIIHEAEPIQTVFLSKKGYTHIQTIRNVRKPDSYLSYQQHLVNTNQD